jgi:hypothetical protein
MIVLPNTDRDALQGVNHDIASDMPHVAPPSLGPAMGSSVARAHERIEAFKFGEVSESATVTMDLARFDSR